MHVVRTTTAQRVLWRRNENVRDFYSVSSFVLFFVFYKYIYIEVVSIAIESIISENVRCKSGKRESRILSC